MLYVLGVTLVVLLGVCVTVGALGRRSSFTPPSRAPSLCEVLGVRDD